MKSNKLKIGIVGLGEQTIDNLFPSLYLSQLSKVVAICDIDESQLTLIGERTGIGSRYLDYKKMIDCEELDVVVVCSFPDIHYEVSKYAINKGINVFVEKPPTANGEQLIELIHLAKFKTVKTGVGMNFSYTDSDKLIKEIIGDDEFGEISFISVEHISSKPTTPLWNLETIQESFLLAQLIHPLDYILSFGGVYKNIEVHCSKTYTPFFIQVMIEFENGVIGCLKSGSFYPRFKHEVEIISKTGNTIKAKDLSIVELTKKDISTPFNIAPKNCSILYTPSPLKSGYSRAGYINEFDAFFKFILFNSPYSHSFFDMLPVYNALELIMDTIDEKNNGQVFPLEAVAQSY